MEAPPPMTINWEQLARVVEQLQAQNQTLVNQVATLQNQQATTAAQPTPQPTDQASQAKFRPKLHIPDTFNGTRKDLLAFISQLDIYTTVRAADFPTESDKLLFATSFLRGKAFNWIQPQLAIFKRNLDSGNPTTFGPYVSYATFINYLKSTFGEIDEEATAERQLSKLRQTTSAAAYSSEFMRISSHLSWDNNALVAIYYQGLKDTIKDHLFVHGRPSELQDLIKLSVQLDNRMFERQKEKSARNTAKTWSSHPTLISQPADPMDLDALTFKTKANPAPQSSSPRGPLSAQEKQHRIDNKLCLYCGKPGHTVQTCFGAKKRNSVTTSKN